MLNPIRGNDASPPLALVATKDLDSQDKKKNKSMKRKRSLQFCVPDCHKKACQHKKTVSRPAVKPIARPMSRLTEPLVAKPVAKHAVQVAVEPATQWLTQPVAKTTVLPADKSDKSASLTTVLPAEISDIAAQPSEKSDEKPLKRKRGCIYRDQMLIEPQLWSKRPCITSLQRKATSPKPRRKLQARKIQPQTSTQTNAQTSVSHLGQDTFPYDNYQSPSVPIVAKPKSGKAPVKASTKRKRGCIYKDGLLNQLTPIRLTQPATETMNSSLTQPTTPLVKVPQYIEETLDSGNPSEELYSKASDSVLDSNVTEPSTLVDPHSAFRSNIVNPMANTSIHNLNQSSEYYQSTDYQYDPVTGTYYGNMVPTFPSTADVGNHGNAPLTPAVFDQNTTWSQNYGAITSPQLPEEEESSIEEFCKFLMGPAEDAFQ